MNGFIKVPPPSLSYLAANALPGANAAYLRKTYNRYHDDQARFLDLGNGLNFPVSVLDKSIHCWLQALVTDPIRRLRPYALEIPKFSSSDTNRNLLKKAGMHQNDIKSLESDPLFKWELPAIEKTGKALEDIKIKSIQVLLSPNFDNLREYLIEPLGCTSEYAYGLSNNQLELQTDAILKHALIKLGILNLNNLKEISRNKLETIARHIQTILDFPNQKERFFIEEPAGFSKEFLKSFFNVLDSIDYKIEIPQNPNSLESDMKYVSLKEIIFEEIVNRAKNSSIPESLLDAMPRTWHKKLLFLSADNRASTLFQRLLDKGIITVRNDGKTILHHIVMKKYTDILEVLLKHKDIEKIISVRDQYGWTPLYYIHPLEYEKLLKAGADGILCYHPDGSPRATLWHPVSLDKSRTLRAIGIYDKLIDTFSRFDTVKQYIGAPNQEGNTALHEAIKFYAPDIVEKLINIGASVQDVNIQTGDTVLHLAKTKEMVKLLIKNEAKSHLESCDMKGDTPFLKAAREGWPEVVAALYQSGANIKAANTKTGENVLHILCQHKLKNPEIFKLLSNLEIQELMNLSDNEGNFPLYHTLKGSSGDKDAKLKDQDQITMMKELLKRGARSDIENPQNGENIWHLAIREATKRINEKRSIDKILEMFDVLIQSHAKTTINAQNHNGERPLDVAVNAIDALPDDSTKGGGISIYMKLKELGAISTDSVDHKN